MILLVPKNLPVRNPTDNNKAHVEATFNRGFQDAVALRHEITALFQQNVTPEILSMDTPIHV